VSEADFCWINTDAALQQFCLEVTPAEGETVPAFFDTEADSLHHYQEKLCLIQLAVRDRFVLIDPFTIEDIRPLLSLLEKTQLWLHGADYDLSLLKRAYGWMPPKIYDTQIASRLVGHRAFGLAALVLHYTGVALCKSSQKEDWSQRPLPEKMQAYAVDDVRYLPEVSRRLIQELEQANRMAWFEESCESLREDVLERQVKDREEAWRISGAGRFKPPGLALLRDLWRWRESMASERDVPPFRILNNQQMLTMATDWERVGWVTIPPRWRGKWRSTFEDMLNRVKTSNPETWPDRPKKSQRRTSDEEKARIDALCKARDSKADALGIEASLLGSRAVMEDIVLNGTDPARVLMDWQREVLGSVLESARVKSAEA